MNFLSCDNSGQNSNCPTTKHCAARRSGNFICRSQERVFALRHAAAEWRKICAGMDCSAAPEFPARATESPGFPRCARRKSFANRSCRKSGNARSGTCAAAARARKNAPRRFRSATAESPRCRKKNPTPCGAATAGNSCHGKPGSVWGWFRLLVSPQSIGEVSNSLQ